MAINIILMLILREICGLKLDKKIDPELDVQNTTTEGAALDVHAITSSW